MGRSRAPRSLIDPDPVTLAFLILGAATGTASAIVALRNYRRARKEAKKEFANRRQRVARALRKTWAAHSLLVGHLRNEEQMRAAFKIGSARLTLSPKGMAAYTKAAEDLIDELRRLNEVTVELADKAEGQLDADLRRSVERIDDALKAAVQSGTYGEFAERSRTLLMELDALLKRTT